MKPHPDLLVACAYIDIMSKIWHYVYLNAYKTAYY